jgi:hypothetical protein
MHVRELAELAALISFHAPLLVAESDRLDDDAMADYWRASRCRLDRWGRALRASGPLAGRDLTEWFSESLPLLEEIVVSEMLTHCATAFFAAHDYVHNRDEALPLGRNIYIGHVEARDRVLKLLMMPAIAATNEAKHLKSHMRRCQTWTDLLMGHFLAIAPVSEFAFNPNKANDFAQELEPHQQPGQHNEMRYATLSGAIQLAFRPLVDLASPNADLNSQICGALVASFGAEFFDSHGLLRSPWLRRLERIPDETLAAIEQYWCDAPRQSPKPKRRIR